MKYLLDTNICIYIIKRKPEKVIRRFLELNPGDIFISAVTVAELDYGVAKSGRPEQNAIALREFLLPLEMIDFTRRDALTYGKIRNEHEKKGKPIGAMDLLIASQAVSREITLITNNEKEFKRIPNLNVENWVK